jgi:hypothetical protein
MRRFHLQTLQGENITIDDESPNCFVEGKSPGGQSVWE